MRTYERHSCKLFRKVLLTVPVVLGISVAAAQPVDEGVPRLVGIRAPESFELNDPRNMALFVAIEAENVDPMADGQISVTVSDRAGRPLEVPVLNTLSPLDLFFGRNEIAIQIGYAASFRGMHFPVRICAHGDAMEGDPCAVVELLDQGDPIEKPKKGREEYVARLKELFPDIGCRCKSGTVRMDPADTNHGSLGSFGAALGGAAYGPFHQSDAAAGTETSVYKFEPHFEIEIINPPKKPDGMDEKNWSAIEKLLPALCEEGQKVNGTTTIKRGTPAEDSAPLKDKTVTPEKEYPYEDTTDETKFTWDAHGYRQPGKSADPDITGAMKAYDTNVIHWLDAPGLTAKPTATMKRYGPMSQKNQFLSFVHGTTGKDEDNCDCFFGIESGVVDANGKAGPSVLLKKPECK